MFHQRPYLLHCLLVACLLASCRSTTLPGSHNTNPATERWGDQVEVYPNSTGEYMLYVQVVTKNSVAGFMVLRARDGEIVLDEKFLPGYIKWLTATTLEVLSIPGILKENEDLSDYKKIIDIHAIKN